MGKIISMLKKYALPGAVGYLAITAIDNHTGKKITAALSKVPGVNKVLGVG